MTQFSVVLKHLRKHRPDWTVHVKCGRGKHTALLGLCDRVFHDQEPEPEGPYDSKLALGWYENYLRFTDRPNSKITNCLQEVFGIDYDPELARYSVRVSSPAMNRATKYLESIGAKGDRQYNVVLIHYEGNTSPYKKNLSHWQAQALCELVIRCGRIPVVLDWDNRSPLPDGKRIFCPPLGVGDIWGSFGSGDAETIAALISCAEAYIGVDSGPGKIASSTDTPALICWRGHHPIQFHDPADNTTHMVPEEHRSIPPCGDDSRIADYFERHYKFRTYSGEHGLVAQAQRWLAEALNATERLDDLVGVQFVLPNGIGDVMWALTKIRQIASNRPIDIILSGDPRREIDQRAVPFVKRFPFVRSVCVSDVPSLEDREHPTNNRGRYRYLSDGVKGAYHYLMPNAVLENGRRLEEWLPEVPIDWNVIDHFDWDGTERGRDIGRGLPPFAAFYLGPEIGNTSEGHNRNWLWEPKHWISLAQGLQSFGLRIVVVGATKTFA